MQICRKIAAIPRHSRVYCVSLTFAGLVLQRIPFTMRYRFFILSVIPIALLWFTACKTPVVYTQGSSITISETNHYDSSSYRVLSPYVQLLKDSMNTVIGHTETALMNTRRTGNLGRVIADYTLTEANAYCQQSGQAPCHMAVLNNGGLRNSIGQGPITLGQVFEVSPFENKLVIVQLSGSQTAALLEYIAAQGGTPVAGIELEFQEAAPYLVRAMVQGQAFDSRRSYRIATNDYMALGGDKFTMFLQHESVEETPLMIRDVLLRGLQHETQQHSQVLDRPTLRVYPHDETEN